MFSATNFRLGVFSYFRLQLINYFTISWLPLRKIGLWALLAELRSNAYKQCLQMIYKLKRNA